MTSTTTPIGTETRKTQRHDPPTSMMVPASTGPASEAMEPITPNQPMATPRRSAG
ncbi:MAG: hypothetical protein R2755_24030 [Acidimicrobiales bacterium]